MKKTFVICSSLAVVLLCWGTLLHICQWPGGNTMLLIAAAVTALAAILGIVCACSGLLPRKGFAIFACVAFLLMTVGIAFYACHWPGAYVMLISSIGVMLPVAALWYCAAACMCKKQ